jgi:predicted nucleic acid-binding protein
MKQFFDTSVLIAAFVEDEKHHDACAEIVATAKDGAVFAHGMAECFSILTGGRLSVQISAGTAATLLEANVAERMHIVTLTPKEIVKVLKDSHAIGVRGGGIYDAMHLAAARKAGADEILTLNVRHFHAFAPDLMDRIRCP